MSNQERVPKTRKEKLQDMLKEAMLDLKNLHGDLDWLESDAEQIEFEIEGVLEETRNSINRIRRNK